MKPQKPGKRNLSELPRVTILTPNWNSGRQILEFIASIKALNYPRQLIETIIIDNNSQDGSPQQISQKFPWVKLIRLKENVGFPKAVNIGIKQSTGAYIFIGNDDLVLSPDSIWQMVKKLEDRPEIGILGGKIFFKDKRRGLASSGNTFNFLLGINKNDNRSPNQEKEPLWVDGCAMMIPRDVIKKVGLLDEGFSLIYFEDADFAIRTKAAGFKVVYDPKIIFYHGQSLSFKKFPSYGKWLQWYKSKTRFILKHSPLLFIFTSLTVQLLTIFCRNIIYQDGSFRPLLQAFKWNFSQLKDIWKERNTLLH